MEIAAQSPFRVLPTAQERETRARKNSLERAFARPEEVVAEMSRHFFAPSVAKSFQNAATCIMQLQAAVMNSPHSQNMSDFAAICAAFAYRNTERGDGGKAASQTQTQAVAFLRNVVEKKYQNFDFAPDEQDFIVSVIAADPPIYRADYSACVSIVEFFCRSEDRFCLGRFIERLKLPDIGDESKRFLMKCSSAIVEFNQQISTNERDFLTAFSSQKIGDDGDAAAVKDFEQTPTKQKIDKLILNNQIENISNIFKPYKLIYFIVASLVIFVVAILL